MFNDIGKRLGLPFIFGIGGIGDFLLCMSDGVYDNCDELGLIFWANNPTSIKEIVKLFPKIKRTLITPNYLNDKTNALLYFNKIINDPYFVTKAHIPDRLDYVNEWYGCNVFDKYKILHNPMWATEYREQVNSDYNIIVPCGGSSDTDWKRKIIKPKLLYDIINECNNDNKKVVIISTYREFDKYYSKYDYPNISLRLDEDFQKLFETIRYANKVYSVNTWVQPLSLFMGIEFILIDSIIINSPYNNMEDPGDFIFNKRWNISRIIKQ